MNSHTDDSTRTGLSMPSKTRAVIAMAALSNVVVVEDITKNAIRHSDLVA